MHNHRCLSKKHIKGLIEHLFCRKELNGDYDDLTNNINESEGWCMELSVLTYFLSQVLEQKLKQNIDCNSLINFMYDLPDSIWLTLQEFDVDYIDFMFRYPRKKNLSLEEILMEIQDHIGNFDYDQAIRG